jgi:hypothetical protein
LLGAHAGLIAFWARLSCWPWARNSFASSSCQYLKYDTSDFPDIGLGFKGFSPEGEANKKGRKIVNGN